NDAAEKTRAEGNAARKKASTPRAQPTSTGEHTAGTTSAQATGTTEREPEKPTAEAEASNSETAEGRDIKHLLANLLTADRNNDLKYLFFLYGKTKLTPPQTVGFI
ncbi:MAG TPA: hypothetical protein VIQ31_37590, partial [Phormidium sp.]